MDWNELAMISRWAHDRPRNGGRRRGRRQSQHKGLDERLGVRTTLVEFKSPRGAQLVQDGASIARLNEDNSPAEQHLIQWLGISSWTVRSWHFEVDRFRALVVNSVIATDIYDTELKALRNRHWDRVFCHP